MSGSVFSSDFFRLPAVALALVVTACAPPGPDGLAVYTASLPLEGPCPTTIASTSEFAAEISELRATVSGAGAESVTASAPVGEALEIENVPAGEDRSLALYGVASSGAEPWRGVTRGITVTEGERVNVDVLLTRVADLSCPRSAHSDARAFHTATLLQDGRILLVGGASVERDASATCADCVTLSATTAVDLYDPSTGAFTPVGGLQVRRMMHTATLLDDGRVVIFGGSEEARIDPTLNFPMVPTLLVGLIEVFDPADDSLRSAGDQVAFGRAFHAAAPLPNGGVIVTGGIDSASALNDLSNALDSSITCFGNPLACGAGPTMRRRRAGHTAALIETPEGTQEVTLWGGSVGFAVDDGAPVYQLESLADLQIGWTIRSVSAMSSSRNLFFAATSQYSEYRVLSAGGLERFTDGTFRLATADAGSGGPVFVYDAIAEDGKGGIATRIQQNLPAMATRAPFFYGSAAALPGANRAAIAGGFISLDFFPTNALDFYNESDLSVTPLSVGGSPRSLREPRGGLVAVGVGNGTILMSGGSAGDATLRVPLATSEIFTDSLDPTQ